MVRIKGPTVATNKFIKAEDSVPIINSLTPREKGEVVIEAVVSEAGVGFVSALFSGVVVEPQLPLGRGQPIQVYLVKIS
jgi:hypothetical protein